MTIPSLKRIKVNSQQDLQNWMSKNTAFEGPVMFVVSNKKSPLKHIPNADIRKLADDFGWTISRSYTLPGNLIGHVAHHAQI